MSDRCEYCGRKGYRDACFCPETEKRSIMEIRSECIDCGKSERVLEEKAWKDNAGYFHVCDKCHQERVERYSDE